MHQTKANEWCAKRGRPQRLCRRGQRYRMRRRHQHRAPYRVRAERRDGPVCLGEGQREDRPDFSSYPRLSGTDRREHLSDPSDGDDGLPHGAPQRVSRLYRGFGGRMSLHPCLHLTERMA